jgi:SAM-dependent methyltransferase
VTAESNPFNYRYFIDHAARLGGRVLDYGCGYGQMLALGLDRSLDIWGADTFEGYYAAWPDIVPAQVREYIYKIEDGRADFPDAHFDVVLSNQVLEHVRDPEAAIADMHRLLKPGGTLIVSFPVSETWYEGHVGLYFAHRLPKGSMLRETYFSVARKLGYGLYYENITPTEWARYSAQILDDVCFYYPRTRLRRAFESIFSTPVEDISADYMRARLGERAQKIPTAADPLLRFIYRKRAGEILRVKKPG